MTIDQLEARVRARLPLDARPGTRVRAVEALDGHAIEVVYRIDRKGQRAINYFCDGARMSRATLLMLMCRETACPQVQAVRLQWRTFIGKPERPATARVTPLRPAPLMVEVAVEGAGHHCVARPAPFECLTPCPLGAHAPQVLHKTGWDLFEDGTWGGHLCVDKGSSRRSAGGAMAGDASNSTLALFDRCRCGIARFRGWPARGFSRQEPPIITGCSAALHDVVLGTSHATLRALRRRHLLRAIGSPRHLPFTVDADGHQR
jgi:hypothetical protein